MKIELRDRLALKWIMRNVGWGEAQPNPNVACKHAECWGSRSALPNLRREKSLGPGFRRDDDSRCRWSRRQS